MTVNNLVLMGSFQLCFDVFGNTKYKAMYLRNEQLALAVLKLNNRVS